MQSYALALPPPRRILENRLTGIGQPVLVILAGRSPMHDADGAADLARRALRHGTVLVYPDASHAINGEYPNQIAADLADFLENAG